MTGEELMLLRQQADEKSAMIPAPTKKQLRQLIAVFDAVVAASGPMIAVWDASLNLIKEEKQQRARRRTIRE